MTEIRTYDTAELVAKAAAENAIELLTLAIEQNGKAVWVLAGGTSPIAAYTIIVRQYADTLDWSRVTIIMGDERFVSLADEASNWGTIVKLFESNELTAKVRRLVPGIEATVEATAAKYDAKIQSLVKDRFDLVWLGVGEDGHTLSLFPGNPAFEVQTAQWVVPVYDVPKPPSERISLSLHALEYVNELVIFATGAGKKEVLRTARLKGGLPVAVAAEVAEMNGAEVRWLYDDAAWGEK